jgi:hypothetical protein
MDPDNSGRAELIKDCGIASVAVTAAVMAAGHVETGTVWRGINAVSHILHGEGATTVDGFEPEVSLPGIALNALSVSAWLMLYRLAFGSSHWPRSLLPGLVGAMLAYGVDYFVLPRRLAPGFEECLSHRSVALIYAVLGLCFAVLGPAATRE